MSEAVFDALSGDAVWACTSKYGNCTDFHSLFIGMARSPASPRASFSFRWKRVLEPTSPKRPDPA